MRKLLFTFILIAQSVSYGQDVRPETEGSRSQSGLKKKISNVPQFEIYQKKVVNGKTEVFRVKTFPRLKIGTEARIKSNVLKELPLPEPKAFTLPEVEKLLSPQEVVFDQQYLAKTVEATDAKIVVNVLAPEPITPLPTFEKSELTFGSETKPEIKALNEPSLSELKLLQALLYIEKKNFELAFGLLTELTQDPIVKFDAIYNLGITALGLKLDSEHSYQMSRLIKEAKGTKEPWQKLAAESLIVNARTGDLRVATLVEPLLAPLALESTPGPQFFLNLAKVQLERDDLNLALISVDRISMDSSIYPEALLLKSLLKYRTGLLAEAIQYQQLALENLEKTRPKSELKSVAAFTMARLYFQNSQYKEAFDAYLKVDRKHPDWLQAMTEQAWAQIIAKDYEGAAGNMFSLHTDFFQKSFAPESYIVRAVGYLNLCQFGDGAKVINEFQKRYTPTLKLINSYLKNVKEADSYYESVKTWAKNPDLKTVDGLPSEFVYYLTRNPQFQSNQERINLLEDEISKLNKITLHILRTEKKYLTELNNEKARLVDAKKKREPAAEILLKEESVQQANIRYFISKKARLAMRDFRAAGLLRLDQEKDFYRNRASLALQDRFTQLTKSLTSSLDQAEVVQYEIYSGAGEHLRFQMAGGEATEEKKEELKVADGKSLKWDFKGEVWKDEIGHYRSSLKSVCPAE